MDSRESNNSLIDKEVILFVGNMDKPESVIKKMRSFVQLKYLIGDIDIAIEELKGMKKLSDLDEIVQIRLGGGKNPFVLIASNVDDEIKKIAEELLNRGIQFDHADFYLTQRINVRYLQLMKKYEYIDWYNNRIYVSENAKIRKLYIDKKDTSRDNTIKIGKISIMNVFYICPIGRNGYVEIGDFTTVQEARITVNSDGIVKIGESCMISTKVNIMQSDHHPIFDAKTGERINKVKNVVVAKHVWLGREAKLLPGAHIGRNSVVAAYTVTSSKFPENVIIAGCPGKVIREGIIWARDRLREGDYSNIIECIDVVTNEYWQEKSKMCENVE